MRPGITEVVWNKEFGEHQRLMWTGFIGVVSAVAAYFVPKTAIQELNVLLSVYLVVNGVFIVHVQRKFGSFRAADGVRFSRYSVRFFIAGLVLLNLGGLAGIGMQTFSHFGVLFDRTLENSGHSPPRHIVLPFAHLTVGMVFVLVLWRMRWFHLFFLAPRRFFIQCIHGRRVQALSLGQFMAFELGVVYYTFFLWWAFSYVTGIILGTTVLY